MQKKFVKINNKVENFNKKINIDGDKSLSIRWALLASQAIGTVSYTHLTLPTNREV